MLILLPPSETKRAGGGRRPMDVAGLALPELRPQREAVIDALVAASRDEEAAARILKLSAGQRDAVADNSAIRRASTMPAIDRYTGVLYDALAATSLDPPARRWLGGHVLIQSAPFGLVGALDRIPSYRLAAGIALPGLPSLRRIWAEPTTRALAGAAPRFVLDLRSEAYAALGPVPATVRSAYVRVVAGTGDGAVRALNHFNKHAKGALVRSLALERPRIASRAALLEWAARAGWRMREASNGEILLAV